MAVGQRYETKLRDSEFETAKAKERATKSIVEEYRMKRNEERIEDLKITTQGIAACAPWPSTTMGRAVWPT